MKNPLISMVVLLFAVIFVVAAVDAVASPQPVTGPNTLVDSCSKYGLFVMRRTDHRTGGVVYVTFSCKRLFESDVPPPTPKRLQSTPDRIEQAARVEEIKVI